jgi:cyclophilin family peptidyl-prolyl cis-trans isomerase
MNADMNFRLAVTTLVALVLAGCSGGSNKSEKPVEKAPEKAVQAPEKFYVKFATTKGDFIMEVVRSWAARGADRFYELVREKFYDGSRFFRVRPGFIVQFGISKSPQMSELWRQLKLPDDPVTQHNQRGYVSFAMAGPGSRTTQVFINLTDNSQRLDGSGFAPFGRVVEGMDIVDKLYASYGEVQSLGGGGPDPQKIEAMGEEYLARTYPRLDKIEQATIVEYVPKEVPKGRSKR